MPELSADSRRCVLPHRALLVGTLVIVARSGQTASSQTIVEPLTPRQILARMAATYAHCKSYRDTGSVETYESNRVLRRLRDDLTFTTVFVRPNRFRFEYHENAVEFSHYVIWTDGRRVRTWWDELRCVRTPATLDDAIAAATGVSRGSSCTVPALLLPQKVACIRLTDLEDLRRLSDATVGGARCYRVAGYYPAFAPAVSPVADKNGPRAPDDRTALRQDPTIVWIDKSTFLVRRVEEWYGFKRSRTRKVTTYHPFLNAAIPRSALAFNPPVKRDPLKVLWRAGCFTRLPLVIILGTVLGYLYGIWVRWRRRKKSDADANGATDLAFVDSRTGEAIPSTLFARAAAPLATFLPFLAGEVATRLMPAWAGNSGWDFWAINGVLFFIVGRFAAGAPYTRVGGAPVFIWPHDAIARWQYRRRQRRAQRASGPDSRGGGEGVQAGAQNTR